MIGYTQVSQLIKAFAEAHKVGIRYYSEFREQLPNLSTEDVDFPLIFVEPVGGDTLEFAGVIEVEVYCLDRLRKDRKNTEDVLNDTGLILNQDLTRWLEDSDEAGVLESETPYPLQYYNNYLLDYVAGCSIRLRVDIERIALCEIPLNDITPEPTCPDATVENSNESYSDTVEAGGTLVLPDSPIQVNGSGVGSIPSVSELEVELQDSSGEVTPDSVDLTGTTLTITLPDSTPERIGAKLLKTGVTASIATGDDGQFQAGRDDSWFMLDTSKPSNPFGHWQKFTGTTGGYYNQSLGGYYDVNGVATTKALAIPDGIILDWSQFESTTAVNVGTVLGYRPVNLGVLVWAAALTAYTSLSVGIYTSGWRMWNENEALAVRYRPMAGAMYNWSPFEVPVLSSHTSTPLDETDSGSGIASVTSFGIGQVGYSQGLARNTYGAVRLFTVNGTTIT